MSKHSKKRNPTGASYQEEFSAIRKEIEQKIADKHIYEDQKYRYAAAMLADTTKRRFLKYKNAPKPTWLQLTQNLTDAEFLEVMASLLVFGESVIDAANGAVERYPKLRGIPHSELTAAMRDLRLEVAPLLLIVPDTAIRYKAPEMYEEVAAIKRRLEEARKDVDALEEAYWAMQLQKKRVQAIVNREKSSNFVLLLAHRDIELFHRQCMDVVDAEMKLGLRNRAPQEINLKVAGQFAHAVQTIDSSVPGGTTKVAEATRKLVSALKEQPLEGVDLAAYEDAELVEE